MTLKNHFRMTASELAMGRYMRAPDHAAADEFSQAFDQFGKEPAAGAADDKGGGDGTGASGEAAPAGGAADAPGGDGDGGAADDKGGTAPAADDKGGAPAPVEDKTPAEGDDKGGAAAPGGKSGEAGGDDKAPAAGAPAADDKGGKKKAPAAAAAPAASESDDDVLKRLAAAVKKTETEDKAPAAVEDKEVQEEPLFTKDEEAKIEHFKKEWPEVAEAFDLQARALAQSVLKYAFQQIGGVINPMRETIDILATRTHYGDLKEKVGEYTPEEREEIIGWVKEQPTYLQTAMMSVIDGGTAEEVADLVGRYREATGKQPAGARVEDKGPQGRDVELSDEAKKAAAALAPVNTKRSAVQAAEDTSDFGAAFTKFADELG
jgi:hypothetical protein